MPMKGKSGDTVVARRHFEFKETAVTIIAEERLVPVAERTIFKAREAIERYIRLDPLFETTLEPYEPPSDAHPIIRHMCEAARKAGVGPMASVAGTIAEEALRALMKAGSRHAIVDNGGDIALLLDRPIDIGIFTLNDRFKDLGFHVDRLHEPFGICTSSSSVGPSLSFGNADAATVIARDVTLADACATRLGNEVKTGEEKDLDRALSDIMSIEGVDGCMVIIADRLAMKGEIPALARMSTPTHAISKIELAGHAAPKPARKTSQGHF
jgi:ApbE superfamily uncharacterized protein (UPF0280 family)